MSWEVVDKCPVAKEEPPQQVAKESRMPRRVAVAVADDDTAISLYRVGVLHLLCD